MRIPLAVIHLLALGIGLGAIFARARATHRLKDGPDTLRNAFVADSWWGVAAFLWITTGLWRAIGGLEKSSSFYWNNHVFYAKMGMLVLVILLEIWPMVTLVRWRRASKQASIPSTELSTSGPRIARISDVQTLLTIGMVIAAVMMARGYGVR